MHAMQQNAEHQNQKHQTSTHVQSHHNDWTDDLDTTTEPKQRVNQPLHFYPWIEYLTSSSREERAAPELTSKDPKSKNVPRDPSTYLTINRGPRYRTRRRVSKGSWAAIVWWRAEGTWDTMVSSAGSWILVVV